MDAIEAAETILRSIDFIKTSWDEHAEKQSELDKQLCDLDHFLENSIIEIHRGYQFAKQRQDVLRERRQVKTEREMLDILYRQVIDTGNGKAFINALTTHLGGAKKFKSKMDNPMYAPRSERFKAKEDIACES